MGSAAALACLLACLAAILAPSRAQFGGMGGPQQPTFKAVKSDLPFIRCQVCEQLAKAAVRQVKTARDEVKPGKKVRALKARPAVACGCRLPATRSRPVLQLTSQAAYTAGP